MEIETIKLERIKDFDLAHIFECGQCFRWNPSEDGESYVGMSGDYAGKASFNQEKGELVLEVTGGDRKFWSNYFDLNTNYSLIKETLLYSEPKIEDAIEYGKGIRILNQDKFETLISFIISQNNNIPRIKKCIESICRNYGENLGEVFGEERFAFPDPERLSKATVEELMALKLGYRSKYIVASTKKYMEEGCPANYDEVLAYPGVGPKVANCIMLFGLHDVEAFPIDTWVKQIMKDMYGFEDKDVRGMSEFASKRFGEYAGYAQQYLFYYYRDRK
ncbi:MAG TPA: 8-oxoguanine DNA glycosylase [Mogibacterium sp.]|nr:8-oxoguanine DNA glycosylase [Mogibacterium sp.]